MKSLFPSFSSRLTELNLRPLLYVAGAAAATAGLCYLYRSLADRQPRKPTVDAAVQTEAEDPVQMILQMISGEIRNSFWTLRVSHRRRYDRERGVLSVKRDFVLLARGAVTQSCWSLTNDFFKPTPEGLFRYASVHRVTLAQHVQGRLVRVISYTFTERNRLATSKGFHGVPVKKSFWIHAGIVIGQEECLVPVPGGTDVIIWHADTQPGRASARVEAAERLRLEERQAPALFYYCRTQGIEGVLFKLTALRKASTILLSQPEARMSLEASGRRLLGGLARANRQDVNAFREKYDNLLVEIQKPQHRVWIELELAQIGIQHFNFIDVIFELVLLGIWGRARIFQTIGVHDRFLDVVMEVLEYCTSKQRRRNRGSRLIHLFQAEMLLLLKELFKMDDDLYEDPEALATALWDTLKFHTLQFQNILSRVVHQLPP